MDVYLTAVKAGEHEFPEYFGTRFHDMSLALKFNSRCNAPDAVVGEVWFPGGTFPFDLDQVQIP